MPEPMEILTPFGNVLARPSECSHCGKSPFPDEMVEAVRLYADGRSGCSVCGRPFEVKSGRFIHSTDKQWVFVVEEAEPYVTVHLGVSRAQVSPTETLPDIYFHVSCLTRAFPKHPWPTMLFPEGK